MEVQTQCSSLFFKIIIFISFFFNHAVINLGYLQFTAEMYSEFTLFPLLIMKHRQDFAGSRSSEENLSNFITHTHIPGIKINYKHLHIHFLQFGTKKKKKKRDWKTTGSANAPFELSCFLYFFIFPQEKSVW